MKYIVSVACDWGDGRYNFDFKKSHEGPWKSESVIDDFVSRFRWNACNSVAVRVEKVVKGKATVLLTVRNQQIDRYQPHVWDNYPNPDHKAQEWQLGIESLIRPLVCKENTR